MSRLGLDGSGRLSQVAPGGRQVATRILQPSLQPYMSLAAQGITAEGLPIKHTLQKLYSYWRGKGFHTISINSVGQALQTLSLALALLLCGLCLDWAALLQAVKAAGEDAGSPANLPLSTFFTSQRLQHPGPGDAFLLILFLLASCLTLWQAWQAVLAIQAAAAARSVYRALSIDDEALLQLSWDDVLAVLAHAAVLQGKQGERAVLQAGRDAGDSMQELQQCVSTIARLFKQQQEVQARQQREKATEKQQEDLLQLWEQEWKARKEGGEEHSVSASSRAAAEAQSSIGSSSSSSSSSSRMTASSPSVLLSMGKAAEATPAASLHHGHGSSMSSSQHYSPYRHHHLQRSGLGLAGAAGGGGPVSVSHPLAQGAAPAVAASTDHQQSQQQQRHSLLGRPSDMPSSPLAHPHPSAAAASLDRASAGRAGSSAGGSPASVPASGTPRSRTSTPLPVSMQRAFLDNIPDLALEAASETGGSNGEGSSSSSSSGEGSSSGSAEERKEEDEGRRGPAGLQGRATTTTTAGGAAAGHTERSKDNGGKRMTETYGDPASSIKKQAAATSAVEEAVLAGQLALLSSYLLLREENFVIAAYISGAFPLRISISCGRARRLCCSSRNSAYSEGLTCSSALSSCLSCCDRGKGTNRGSVTASSSLTVSGSSRGLTFAHSATVAAATAASKTEAAAAMAMSTVLGGQGGHGYGAGASGGSVEASERTALLSARVSGAEQAAVSVSGAGQRRANSPAAAAAAGAAPAHSTFSGFQLSSGGQMEGSSRGVHSGGSAAQDTPASAASTNTTPAAISSSSPSSPSLLDSISLAFPLTSLTDWALRTVLLQPILQQAPYLHQIYAAMQGRIGRQGRAGSEPAAAFAALQDTLAYRALLQRLEKRIFWYGLLGLLLSPFVAALQLLRSLTVHAEDAQARKDYLGPRSWTPRALQMFRDFNELPHVFFKRVTLAEEPAKTLLEAAAGSSPLSSLLTASAEILTFLLAVPLAVLLLFTIIDDDIALRVHVGQHSLLYVASVLGLLVGLARTVVAGERQARLAALKQEAEGEVEEAASAAAAAAAGKAGRKGKGGLSTSLEKLMRLLHFYPPHWLRAAGTGSDGLAGEASNTFLQQPRGAWLAAGRGEASLPVQAMVTAIMQKRQLLKAVQQELGGLFRAKLLTILLEAAAAFFTPLLFLMLFRGRSSGGGSSSQQALHSVAADVLAFIVQSTASMELQLGGGQGGGKPASARPVAEAVTVAGKVGHDAPHGHGSSGRKDSISSSMAQASRRASAVGEREEEEEEGKSSEAGEAMLPSSAKGDGVITLLLCRHALLPVQPFSAAVDVAGDSIVLGTVAAGLGDEAAGLASMRRSSRSGAVQEAATAVQEAATAAATAHQQQPRGSTGSLNMDSQLLLASSHRLAHWEEVQGGGGGAGTAAVAGVQPAASRWMPQREQAAADMLSSLCLQRAATGMASMAAEHPGLAILLQRDALSRAVTSGAVSRAGAGLLITHGRAEAAGAAVQGMDRPRAREGSFSLLSQLSPAQPDGAVLRQRKGLPGQEAPVGQPAAVAATPAPWSAAGSASSALNMHASLLFLQQAQREASIAPPSSMGLSVTGGFGVGGQAALTQLEWLPEDELQLLSLSAQQRADAYEQQLRALLMEGAVYTQAGGWHD